MYPNFEIKNLELFHDKAIKDFQDLRGQIEAKNSDIKTAIKIIASVLSSQQDFSAISQNSFLLSNLKNIEVKLTTSSVKLSAVLRKFENLEGDVSKAHYELYSKEQSPTVSSLVLHQQKNNYYKIASAFLNEVNDFLSLIDHHQNETLYLRKEFGEMESDSSTEGYEFITNTLSDKEISKLMNNL